MLWSFKLALKSIWDNKMYPFLTMLGITIGAAVAIVLVSLANGYIGGMVGSLVSIGVNQINVNVTNLASCFLDADQVYAFYEEHIDLFGELSPDVTLSSAIRYGDDSMIPTSAAGRSEQYLGIKSYELETGRNIAYSDIASRQKVYMIGACVANELYRSSQNTVGRTLKIDGYASRIIGVAEARDADNTEDGGIDDFVRVPYSVTVKMSRSVNITNYTLTVLNTSRANECTVAIRNFLYRTFKDKDLHHVTAMNEMLGSLSEQTATMSGTLEGITGISPLVAGVGVVDIMLVSATEGIREIGIRKFLGTDKGTTTRQFVTETAVTSSLDGIIGTLVGCVVTTVVGVAVGVPATPTLSAVVMSFSVSVGIGLLSGYMPTSRTANLNPIDALRSE